VYLDEAGAENTLDHAYAYSPKGQPVFAERLGHFTERVSMIAAWCVGKVVAPMTFTGHCDSLLVETWFAKVLLPELRPGQTVILDNASFHRHAKLKALLEPLGCHLLPLPPYSPDLNKIESLWHRIKSFVRHNHDPELNFHAKVNAAFCSF
jgi:transposase